MKYKSRSKCRRERDILVRCPEGDEDLETGDVCRVVPYLYTKTTGSLKREHEGMLCPDVKEFYIEQGTLNRNIEVSSRANIADKDGSRKQHGVFSRRLIPAGSRICPYVGEVYHRCPTKGRYVMRIHEELYIDAEYDLFDVGYLYFQDQDSVNCLASPPNYGRYINTIYPDDMKHSTYHFNCAFIADESGLDVVWVEALEDIPQGTELLVDYGICV